MTLIFLLQRSRTGFKRSDGIINRLILFSLNTGLLTGLDAVASLIAVSPLDLFELRSCTQMTPVQNIVWSDTFIYILFFFNISRCKCRPHTRRSTNNFIFALVYTNSLMAT